MAKGGRPRRWKTPKAMAADWGAFKTYCDSKTKLETKFDGRQGVFVTDAIPAPVTYTILGFCIYAGISKQAFYEYYESDERFVDLVQMIKAECEQDAREKLEKGVIPTQLSGLWMGRYGYTTKQEDTVAVNTNFADVENKIQRLLKEADYGD